MHSKLTDSENRPDPEYFVCRLHSTVSESPTHQPARYKSDWYVMSSKAPQKHHLATTSALVGEPSPEWRSEVKLSHIRQLTQTTWKVLPIFHVGFEGSAWSCRSYQNFMHKHKERWL